MAIPPTTITIDEKSCDETSASSQVDIEVAFHSLPPTAQQTHLRLVGRPKPEHIKVLICDDSRLVLERRCRVDFSLCRLIGTLLLLAILRSFFCALVIATRGFVITREKEFATWFWIHNVIFYPLLAILILACVITITHEIVNFVNSTVIEINRTHIANLINVTAIKIEHHPFNNPVSIVFDGKHPPRLTCEKITHSRRENGRRREEVVGHEIIAHKTGRNVRLVGMTNSNFSESDCRWIIDSIQEFLREETGPTTFVEEEEQQQYRSYFRFHCAGQTRMHHMHIVWYRYTLVSSEPEEDRTIPLDNKLRNLEQAFLMTRPPANTAPKVSLLPTNRGPVIVMGMVVLGSISAVVYSHYAQVRDKAVMREGVERDKERLRRIRRQKEDLG